MAGVDWNITDGTFNSGGTNYTFHVAISGRVSNGLGMMSQEISNERRLQISEKPLIDGADVEDFGRKPRTFSAEVIFFGLDYLPAVVEFEKVLNSGKSGTLILPDLEEAVYAKYQKHTRKSSYQDGGSTILSVTWIEDNTKAKLFNFERSGAQAASALAAGDYQAAAPSITDKVGEVQTKIAVAQAALSGNPFLNALATAENSVTSATQTINNAISTPKLLRQNILGTVSRVKLELQSLQSAVKGISNLTDLLNVAIDFSFAPPFATSLGAIDFAKVNDPVTTQVIGQIVVQSPTIPATTIQSLPDASANLMASTQAINQSKSNLEQSTSGRTSDFSSAATSLVNSVRDLNKIIATAATKPILVTTQSTLLEVCFRNGLKVSDIDRVYKLNAQLTDILNIAPMTVLSI